MIKGASTVAKASQRGGLLPIYWDMEKQMITTRRTAYLITELIRPNTAEEVEKAVQRWRWM